MVDLPAPVWPIIPKNPPDSTLNDTSFNTLIEVPGYANVTESKEIEDIGCVSSTASSESEIDGSKSINANTLREAASPLCS